MKKIEILNFIAHLRVNNLKAMLYNMKYQKLYLRTKISQLVQENKNKKV